MLGVCIIDGDVEKGCMLTRIAAKVLIHDIEIRGPAILDTVLLRPEAEDVWRLFFEAAMTSQTRILVAIAAVRIALHLPTCYTNQD